MECSMDVIVREKSKDEKKSSFSFLKTALVDES